MNGPVSQSMREKGLTYKVNFGVELPRLREMAEEWPHNYELAAALWKENIRECRLLAGMLMPTEDFPADLAELWVEQMNFPEEAECTVVHLFARLPYASEKAFAWIAREEPMFRLCGWHLLSRLFMQGAKPSPRDAEEMLDQAASELIGTDMVLKRKTKFGIVFSERSPQLFKIFFFRRNDFRTFVRQAMAGIFRTRARAVVCPQNGTPPVCPFIIIEKGKIT